MSNPGYCIGNRFKMALSSEERVMCIEEQERTYAVAGEMEGSSI